MELYRNGHMVKNMYNSPALTCERVATNIPHVWIEHLKLTDRTVLIVNDELGGFDMDTRSDTVRYSIIEKTFPEVEKVGCRLSGCIEIEDDGTIEKLKNFSLRGEYDLSRQLLILEGIRQIGLIPFFCRPSVRQAVLDLYCGLCNNIHWVTRPPGCRLKRESERRTNTWQPSSGGRRRQCR